MKITIKTLPFGQFSVSTTWRGDGHINSIGAVAKTRNDLEMITARFLDEHEARKQQLQEKK